MHDIIKNRFEKKLQATPHIKLQRQIANEQNEADVAQISKHANDVIDRFAQEMKFENKIAATASTPLKTSEGVSDAWIIQQFDKHFSDRTTIKAESNIRPFALASQCRSVVLAPPYDRQWAQGSAMGGSGGALISGEIYTFSKDNDYSAGGIGFNLTTDKSVLVSIIPQGTFMWGYSLPYQAGRVSSSGGLGITVYKDGETQPILTRQPRLWNFENVTAELVIQDSGHGNIEDAASPAIGFGKVPLAPALVNLEPGARYLVWVWAWQVCNVAPDGKGFFAALSFDMPFVTIDACPPIYLH
ncbi:MAG: hypothetical protein QM802_18450 [Agriterribacter sp.]